MTLVADEMLDRCPYGMCDGSGVMMEDGKEEPCLCRLDKEEIDDVEES